MIMQPFFNIVLYSLRLRSVKFTMPISIHVMTSGMASQEIWMFATGELGNQSNQIFCGMTRHVIYFSEYKQTWVRFHLRSYENENVIFQLFFSDLILAVNV